jgi:hypothetical protein
VPTPTASEVFPALAERLLLNQDGAIYHDYYHGEQSLPVDTSEFRSKFGQVFSAFRANMARPVIDTAEGRLRFNEFGNGTGVAKDALELWERSNMSAESKWVHTDALVWGFNYVIVLPDEEGNATIWPQSPSQCAVVYDPQNPRKRLAAIKWWVETEYTQSALGATRKWVRFNLYFSDRIERYRSIKDGEQFQADLNSYELMDTTRHRVGKVPVYEFRANYDVSSGSTRSDLADATGYVDALTKTILDLLVASEFAAAPQRWATGVEIPLDPKTGEPLETYKSGADKLWTAPSDAAKFGQFSGGDLRGFKEALEALTSQLAHVSRTPLYALMEPPGEYPADSALKTAEIPLRQRVADHQTAFGPVWAEVMQDALKLDGLTVERSEVMPAWLPVNAPFATRELLEEVKVQVEVAGVPEEMAWRKLGYTAAEIEEMKRMREEEATLGQDAMANLQADTIVAGAPPAQTAAGGVAVDLPDPVGAPQ